MRFLILALFVAVTATAPLEPAVEPVEVIVNGLPEGEPLEVGDIVDIVLNEHVDGELVASSDLLYPFTATGLAEAAAAAAEVPDVPAAIVLPVPALPEVIPTPIVLPQPAIPEVNPAPIVLPAPAVPEVVPAPIVLPAPAVPEIVPAPIVLPAPAVPEIVPAPIVLPAPAVPEIVPAPIVLPAPAVPEIIPAPIVLPAPAVPEVIPAPIGLPDPVVPEVVPAPIVPIPEPVAEIPNGEIYNDGNVVVTLNVPQEAGVLSSLKSWFQMVVNYFQNGIVSSQQIV